MRKTILILSALIVCATAINGCAKNRVPYVPPEVSEQADSSERSEFERKLYALVDRRVTEEIRNRDADENDVKRRSPYYYKEYARFPEGTEPISVEFAETESRSKPLTAEVKIRKVRFATKLHRDRTDAQRDTNFYRDTGVEIQEYVLRNNRWVSLGDTFVAERSEEQVGGQWVAVNVPEEDPAAIAASEQGWFRRAWRNVTGR